jgi:acyl-CoA synthetase (AMP-forming)/AMP-acid ligase II/3-hydroxymyristoyl/3-hydroxydecanoyl-(acyl carrier protein) dehydratase
MTAPLLPLSKTLSRGRPPGTLVAFGRGGERRFADLEARAAGLAEAVEAVGRGRWLLHSVNSYAAAVGLLALAQAGCVAVLAPNPRPATLRRLRRGAVGAILDPDPEGEVLGSLPRLAPLAAAKAPRRPWRELDREAPLAELLTSGTTGTPRRVAKAVRHLEDEVEALEARLGAVLPADARIFASVSHQHIYGLLFRVLWPLCAGRPFESETLLHAGELLPRMAEVADCALVTTPVHLRRLAAGEALARVRGSCRAVFCSGGPLEAETAKAVAGRLGEAPLEILGSTETGGVALRQRTQDRESWLPLPGVGCAVTRQGLLTVTSPFASVGRKAPGGARRFALGDRAELLPDGSFRLLGRADRVVKVGEKRLSLPEMERALEAHPWVAEAALLARGRGREERVHAVLVPSARGGAALEARGRRAFAGALASYLAERFDRVLLPRAWRTVAELPRDAQGKLSQATLAALVARPPGPPLPRRHPELLAERRGPSWLERRLRVPADLAFLAGHFEGRPLVAGVVQLRWVAEAARELLGGRPRLRRLEGLKFPELLRPGQELLLRLELSAGRERLRFELAEAGRVFATGRARLASPGEAGP